MTGKRCQRESIGGTTELDLAFLGARRPLPEAPGDLSRQATSQLARQHDDLAAMMTLVCHEVRKDVPNIERKIAPRVGTARRDRAAVITTQRQEADHSATAPVQRQYELLWADPVPIDRRRHLDPMLFAERLDPHATRVMDVPGDHPDCPSRGAWHDACPDLRWQMLDQEDGDPIARSPHGNESILQSEARGHHEAFIQ